ncbi:cytochrome P450 [Nemania serpens]|nr:cytochrome P450 [Nemania serpens]
MITSLILRQWLTASAALLLGAFLYKRIRLLIQLRHIKGSPLLRVSGIPHILAIKHRLPQLVLWSQSEICYLLSGQITVLSPTKLLTSSPDLWARMNTHPGYTRSAWYYRALRFDWRTDNIATQMVTEKHDARRNQMIRGYSGAENLTLEADIEECVVKLLGLVRSKYAGKRNSMDLSQKLLFFSLDVISTIGFGKCFGLLNADDDPNEYIKSVHEGLDVANTQLALGTWWINWIPFLAPKSNLDIKTTKGYYKMSALNASMVEAREKEFREQSQLGVVPRADMLTSFMKNGISGDDLKAEQVLQIAAGSETTSAALNGIFLYVLTNPRVYKFLQAEIDEAVASGKAPQAPELVKFVQAKELRYLQAVIKESMRLHSPLHNPMSRDTPPDGDTVIIDGERVYLPGGVSIVPSFKGMHRNKSVYGEDVDVFRPERWLEEVDETKLVAMKAEYNLIFAGGRWQCLGKGIAMRELTVAVFELFRNFDLAIVDPVKPWKDICLVGTHSTSEMWVQVEERNNRRREPAHN